VSKGEAMEKEWFGVDDEHQVYIRLAPGTSVSDMEQQIAKCMHRIHLRISTSPVTICFSRSATCNFDTRFGNFAGRTISRDMLLAIGIVGLFLLLAASINYINLATAQSVMRAKEIGLRK